MHGTTMLSIFRLSDRGLHVTINMVLELENSMLYINTSTSVTPYFLKYRYQYNAIGKEYNRQSNIGNVYNRQYKRQYNIQCNRQYNRKCNIQCNIQCHMQHNIQCNIQCTVKCTMQSLMYYAMNFSMHFAM